MKIHRYEIHGVKDQGDQAVIVSDNEADYWAIFGFVTAFNGGEFAIPIGDYSSPDQAKLTLGLILGQ